MSFYIDVDEAGNEVKTTKGKGPALKGYLKDAEGNWRKDPTWVAVSKEFVYLYMVDGKYVSHKKVNRGRPPMQHVKCRVETDGTLISLDENVIVPADMRLPDNKIEGPMAPIVIPVVDTTVTLEELKKILRPMKVETNNDVISFIGVEITGDCPISFFQENKKHNRVDVNTTSGTVTVWTNEFNEKEPDKVLIGIVKVEKVVA